MLHEEFWFRRVTGLFGPLNENVPVLNLLRIMEPALELALSSGTPVGGHTFIRGCLVPAQTEQALLVVHQRGGVWWHPAPAEGCAEVAEAVVQGLHLDLGWWWW